MWQQIDIPVVLVDDWPRPSLLEAMGEFERLGRALDAARSLVVAALAKVCGRDTHAAIVRATGTSGRTARVQMKVAEVIGRFPESSEALARGDVSAEHVRLLDRVTDPEAARKLLVDAVSMTPDEFRNHVERHLLDDDEDEVKAQQQSGRSVTFFRARAGNIGMRAILTPLEGAELQSRLNEIADAEWRKNHPDRAATLGGHHDDTPYEKRLADALMMLVRGTGSSSGRHAVVVTVDAETLAADIIGSGPVPLDDVLGFSERAEIYAAIRDADGGVLKLGRSRRLASNLQRLAAVLRDRKCVIGGCDAPAVRCQAHHSIHWEDGGLTDIENLPLLCARHHADTHHRRIRLVREGSAWVVVGAGVPPKPPPPEPPPGAG